MKNKKARGNNTKSKHDRDALSSFVAKFLKNMKSAPQEVHAEVCRRPWDFVDDSPHKEEDEDGKSNK